jgi:MFS family permease
MNTNNNSDRRQRRLAWLILLLIILIGFGMVALPVWIIQPFAPQTERGLRWSFNLRRWSPIVTLIGSAIALILTIWLWRGSRWWRKAALILVLLVMMATTWFARQNHFEWMFNPLARAAYVKAVDATFNADNDMVLAVEINGEAVAYPVRLMAYHHVVADTVGGTPIVATY